VWLRHRHPAAATSVSGFGLHTLWQQWSRRLAVLRAVYTATPLRLQALHPQHVGLGHMAAAIMSELSRRVEHVCAQEAAGGACCSNAERCRRNLPAWGDVLPLAGVYWWAMAATSGHKWSRGQVQDILYNVSQEEVREGCVAYWTELGEVHDPAHDYDERLKGFWSRRVWGPARTKGRGPHACLLNYVCRASYQRSVWREPRGLTAVAMPLRSRRRQRASRP